MSSPKNNWMEKDLLTLMPYTQFFMALIAELIRSSRVADLQYHYCKEFSYPFLFIKIFIHI
jgi:hypothetical protein